MHLSLSWYLNDFNTSEKNCVKVTYHDKFFTSLCPFQRISRLGYSESRLYQKKLKNPFVKLGAHI